MLQSEENHRSVGIHTLLPFACTQISFDFDLYLREVLPDPSKL